MGVQVYIRIILVCNLFAFFLLNETEASNNINVQNDGNYLQQNTKSLIMYFHSFSDPNLIATNNHSILETWFRQKHLPPNRHYRSTLVIYHLVVRIVLVIYRVALKIVLWSLYC